MWSQLMTAVKVPIQQSMSPQSFTHLLTHPLTHSYTSSFSMLSPYIIIAVSCTGAAHKGLVFRFWQPLAQWSPDGVDTFLLIRQLIHTA